jgi:L-ribulose-5-phosphate 4-epimerase
MCEDNAKSAFIAQQLGGGLPIAQADVDALFSRYQNVYGQLSNE